MPDKSDRIRKSVIQTMMNFLLILSVFHRDTSIKDLELCHPKMAIVFNNVSLKECGYDKVLDRIEAYKQLLLEEAIEFYCEKISDDTYIGQKKWKEIKKDVMESQQYENEEWFKKLSQYEVDLISSLKSIQSEIGSPKAQINPVFDPIRKKEIEEKIDVLFKEENFYFYKVIDNPNEEEIKNRFDEESEIERLINDCI